MTPSWPAASACATNAAASSRPIGDRPRDPQLRRHRSAESREALLRREVDQVRPVQRERIEEERVERQSIAHRRDVELASEAAHGDLERLRPAARAQRDRLAVQDRLAHRQALHRGDDLRHGRGHIVQAAAEHAHLAARLVRLDAGAIELVLERRATKRAERILDVGRGLGEHRLDRSEQLDPEAVHACPALRERGLGDHPEVTGHHDGAPDVADREPGGFGDRLDHQAFERALAQLAEQQPDQKILLVGGRAGKQLTQQPRALGAGALAADLDEAIQRRVEIGKRERGCGGRGRAARCAQGRMADADPALARHAREHADRGVDPGGRAAAEEARQLLDLEQSPGTRGDPPRGQDDVVQLHRRGPIA